MAQCARDASQGDCGWAHRLIDRKRSGLTLLGRLNHLCRLLLGHEQLVNACVHLLRVGTCNQLARILAI